MLGLAIHMCTSDAECYGGACVSGSCRCPPLWEGVQCETLRLKPARVASGLRIANASSWGGGVVEDAASGVWHMYAAQFVEHCGLSTWRANSQITHAVGSAADGPFAVVAHEAPVLTTFAHNPTVVQLGGGKYAMAHIGCGDGSTPAVTGCTNGTTCSSNATACWVPPLPGASSGTAARARTPRTLTPRCNTPHWTGLLRASSPAGPFTAVANLSIIVDGGPHSWHFGEGITNPNYYPLPNGSILMAFSTGCANCSVSPSHKHVGLAIGTSVRGPFRDLSPAAPMFEWASEDPCIFFDADSSTYHILAHTDFSGVAEEGMWAHVAAHAVAKRVEGPWRVATRPPYDRTIKWDDGSRSSVRTRERPQIIWNEIGEPVGLTNGVQPGNHSSPALGFPRGFTGDWSYTHVQLLDRRVNTSL